MKRTTFGALEMGGVFFYRSRYYRKRRVLDGNLVHVVGAVALVGTMSRIFSPDTPVWLDDPPTTPAEVEAARQRIGTAPQGMHPPFRRMFERGLASFTPADVVVSLFHNDGTPAKDAKVVMVKARPFFTCPDCKRSSHHPEDGRNRYCGACHKFFRGDV